MLTLLERPNCIVREGDANTGLGNSVSLVHCAVCLLEEWTNGALSSDFKTCISNGKSQRAGNRSPHDLEGLGTKTRHIEIFVFSDAAMLPVAVLHYLSCSIDTTRSVRQTGWSHTVLLITIEGPLQMFECV